MESVGYDKMKGSAVCQARPAGADLSPAPRSPPAAQRIDRQAARV